MGYKEGQDVFPDKIHFVHQYWVIMRSARFIRTIETFLRQKKKRFKVFPIHWTEKCHGKEKQPSVFSLRGTWSGKKLQLSFNYETAASSELMSGLVSCVCRLLQLLSCSHYLKKTVRRCCQISVFTLSPRTSKYTQAVMNDFHVAENGTRNTPCLTFFSACLH